MFSFTYILRINFFFERDGEIFVLKTWRKRRQTMWCFSFDNWAMIWDWISLSLYFPWATVDFGIESEMVHQVSTCTADVKCYLRAEDSKIPKLQIRIFASLLDIFSWRSASVHAGLNWEDCFPPCRLSFSFPASVNTSWGHVPKLSFSYKAWRTHLTNSCWLKNSAGDSTWFTSMQGRADEDIHIL